MFHPANFSIIHKDNQREETSFVGIRRNGAASRSFVLPPGFDQFPVSDAGTVSEYFFKLFRTLRLFRRYVQNYDRDAESDFAGDSGIRITATEEEPAMLYSKIHMLEEVLERYDELRIYNILYRNRRTEEIDYSQIHRYLDKAVYQDDVPYVDEMRLSRPVVEMGVSDLVRMFCFIYTEVSVRTGHERSPEVEAAANQFKAEHLDPDSALFERLDAHRRTVDRLKKKLDDIDRETTYKDEDYWYFFEAVEAFLYGELDENDDGISWGITRFAPVWEDMCMVWLHQHLWDGVVYADSERYANSRIGRQKVFLAETFDRNTFAFELGDHKRHMRPDIVRRKSGKLLSESRGYYFDLKWSFGKTTVKLKREYRKSKETNLLRGIMKKIKSDLSSSLTDKSRRNRSSSRSTFIGVPKEETLDKIEKLKKYVNRDRESEKYRVVDFKCVPKHVYSEDPLTRRGREKARSDERKQIAYEYALQLSGVSKTTSQLCIPTYFDSAPKGIGKSVEERRLHPRFRDQSIEVLRVDFETVLQDYLERGTTEENRML
jgi:hypothetical protein